MQLRQVKGNTWVLDDIQMIPLYKTDDRHCILLDTGFYRQREALADALVSAGLTPVGILGSHAHMDHSANHAFFQEHFRIPVALSVTEAGFSADPLMIQAMYQLPPAYIENTADFRSMVCHPDRIIRPEENRILFCKTEFDIIWTPGHSPGHLCIRTPDQVLYLGDAVMMGEELERAKLPYYFSVSHALSSMKVLQETSCSYCIAAHKGISEDLPAVAAANLDAMQRHIARLLSLLPPDQPLTLDAVIQLVADDLQLLTSNVEKALLYRRLITKYVDYLVDRQLLHLSAQKGIAYYTKPR